MMNVRGYILHYFLNAARILRKWIKILWMKHLSIYVPIRSTKRLQILLESYFTPVTMATSFFLPASDQPRIHRGRQRRPAPSRSLPSLDPPRPHLSSMVERQGMSMQQVMHSSEGASEANWCRPVNMSKIPHLSHLLGP